MTSHMEVDSSPVRWGFIGVGMLAQRATAAAVHEGDDIELFAAAARDAERAATINPEKVHASYDDLLSDPEVEAVYISLNNDAHFPYIVASLQAGKHVLCEKPLTMSAAQTRQAYALAEELGLLLAEATWSLWSPRMRRINQLVAQGAIGSPRNYLSTFTFSGIPEDNYRLEAEKGGGALFDVGIYPLHGIVALLPEETLYSVTSASADNAGYPVDMTTKAHIAWETPDGNRGTGAIVASFDMHPSQRFVIKGTDGEISIPDDQSFTQWHEAGDLNVNDSVETFPAVNPYRLMFEQFSKSIRNRGGWVPGPWQSIRVAEIVEEIQARAN